MDENTNINTNKNTKVNITNELSSLYETIKKLIPKDKLPHNIIKNKEEIIIEEANPLSLINQIKDSIPLLLNYSKKNNNNEELETYYSQLENQLKKLEIDNKYYLKYFMRYKILKDALEMKLNAYIGLEEEYEELKDKVKYEEGKFLENDRKDNEIIILRRENSILKKEIEKLEKKNRKNDIKKKEYTTKIKELEITVESLNKKILNLEKNLKEYSMKNNNLYKNLNSNNSCANIGSLNNENSLMKLDNNSISMNNGNYNYNLNNLKNIYNFNTNKKLTNFYTPKFDANLIEHHKSQNSNNSKTINTINSNGLFNSTFSKIINGINNKKIKIPIKNEYTILKQPRNHSISILKGENDESKSILFNKNEKYPNLNKSNKTRNLNRILNSKPQGIYPLTVKNNGYINSKFIQREIHKNIINNSSSQNL